MRTLIILAAVLGLAACGDRNTYGPSDEDLAFPDSQPAAPAAPAATGGAEAADMAEAPAAAPGATANADCGVVADPEAFVRCLYAGLDRGDIDLSDPADVKVVWGGTDAQVAEYAQIPVEARRAQARVQMTTLCACTEPGRGTFQVSRVVVGPVGPMTDASVTLANGRQVTLKLERNAGGWNLEDAR